jgi:hypothetical protein
MDFFHFFWIWSAFPSAAPYLRFRANEKAAYFISNAPFFAYNQGFVWRRQAKP